MPTTIDSAGITFNDATSLTSANIGTAQLVNGSVIASKLGTTEQKQICKAWVNFNGTLATPITPRASYNVSSVTKSSTGDYTVNFTTPMTDNDYSCVVSGSTTTSEIGVSINVPPQSQTNSVRIRSVSGNALNDFNNLNIQIFGN